ncbi:MAG: serine/threonine-protein kinase, partial [bacterium]
MIINPLVNITAGIKLGKYQLVQEIGRGTMGSVWKAHDKALNRAVAVKILHPQHLQNEKMVRRFRREPMALCRMRHQCIVRVYALEETQDLIYFVMDYSEGVRLDRLINREFLLPLRRALPILSRIADALGEIHRHNIIHRDIKPANIVLEQSDHPIITDFGLAKIDTWTPIAARSGAAAALSEFDKMDTPHEKLTGTPAFLAPERWLHQEYDHRIDIYSFGIMMYQLLTGTLPFDSDNTKDLRDLHLRHPCPPPPLSAGKIPEPVMHIIYRCLQKPPNLRFQSAAEMCDAVRSAIEKLDKPKITPVITFPAQTSHPTATPAMPAFLNLVRPISFILLATALIIFLFVMPAMLLKKLTTAVSDKKDTPARIMRTNEGVMLDGDFNDSFLNQNFLVKGEIEDFSRHQNGTWITINANKRKIHIWTPA